MARTTSLAVYAVKVWSLEDGEYETISSFSGDSDLLDFFQTFLSGLQKKTSRNKTVQQVLRVQSLKRDGRRACGIIETGEYGLESTLINVDTEAVVHRRKTSEANMLPFYFLV